MRRSGLEYWIRCPGYLWVSTPGRAQWVDGLCEITDLYCSCNYRTTSRTLKGALRTLDKSPAGSKLHVVRYMRGKGRIVKRIYQQRRKYETP